MSTLLQEAVARIRDGDTAYFDRLSHEELKNIATKVDEDGRSCLHTAAASGLPDICLQLLRLNPVVVNLADESGMTPLHSASSAGHEAVVDCLAQAHAEVNAASKTNGRTPLHYAASKGQTGVVQLLIEKGAEVNTQDRYGSTPLHGACSALCSQAAEVLVNAQANLNCRDSEGNTPLHLAVAAAEDYQSARLSVFLAGQGAPLDAVNKMKLTPLQLAGPNAPLLCAAAAGQLEETL